MIKVVVKFGAAAATDTGAFLVDTYLTFGQKCLCRWMGRRWVLSSVLLKVVVCGSLLVHEPLAAGA